MLSRFFSPGTGLSPQTDAFGTFQREMNRVFDEVFRGFPAMGRGARREAPAPRRRQRRRRRGFRRRRHEPLRSQGASGWARPAVAGSRAR